MRRLVLVVLLSAAMPAWVSAADPHPDITGEVDDQHGNVSWKSSVKELKDLWEYYYEAKNRDNTRNCNINWVVAKQNWFIAPLKTGKARTELVGTPVKKEGEFRYNGGTASGEGVKNTAAWLDHDPKATKTRTTATIFLKMDRTIYAVDLVASSSFDDGTITYKLHLEPSADSPEYADDFRKLFPRCRVQWASAASPAWTREDRVTLKAGTYGDTGVITLEGSRAGKESYDFEAYVSTSGFGEPIVVKDVLRFFVGTDDDKEVLCEVGVPAVVVKNRE